MSGKRILVLFDVDGTLTEPRADAEAVGIVGGSDLIKQEEQMGKNITKEVNYSFSENGLVAYKDGNLIGKAVRYYSDNL